MLLAPGRGIVRLFNVLWPEGGRNLWAVPNLLLQKFPAPAFTATAKLSVFPKTDGERTGLVVMGLDYASVSVAKRPEGLVLL